MVAANRITVLTSSIMPRTTRMGCVPHPLHVFWVIRFEEQLRSIRPKHMSRSQSDRLARDRLYGMGLRIFRIPHQAKPVRAQPNISTPPGVRNSPISAAVQRYSRIHASATEIPNLTHHESFPRNHSRWRAEVTPYRTYHCDVTT